MLFHQGLLAGTLLHVQACAGDMCSIGPLPFRRAQFRGQRRHNDLFRSTARSLEGWVGMCQGAWSSKGEGPPEVVCPPNLTRDPFSGSQLTGGRDFRTEVLFALGIPNCVECPAHRHKALKAVSHPCAFARAVPAAWDILLHLQLIYSYSSVKIQRGQWLLPGSFPHSWPG